MKTSFIYIFFVVLAWLPTIQAQNSLSFWEPASTYRSDRMTKLASGIGISYAAATIGLSQVWYKDSDQSSFHFFDDWNEWGNMDKYGHFLTAYHYGRNGVTAFQWTGLDKNKAIWLGIGVGNLLQVTVEVLDGYSEKWGFSISDIGFNLAGSFFMAGQEWVWDEQRIVMKLSARPSSYPDITLISDSGQATTTLRARTDNLLGSTFTESWLKDYNQQTIWASFNIHSFLKNPNSKIPKWLNVAVGYGAQNMFGGFENSWITDGERYTITDPHLRRFGQYYLSIDIDLSKIKTKSGFLKTLLTTFNFIKIPAPAIEWNPRDNFEFHLLHY